MSIKSVEMESKIKRVALYLRLSRGEGLDDLNTHERRLIRKCDEHNWSYEMYKEIGSGSTIKDRPVMQQLLNDIERELFDAVIVVDLDRLSRGSGADNDRILYALKTSNTLVVVENPYQILDANNESDEDMIVFKGMIARMEFKQIVKRLKVGKRMKKEQGLWVSSATPYGYKVDSKTRKLTPDDEESKVVVLIKDLFLEGYSCADIAWELNKRKAVTRGALEWRSERIATILHNEVYVGTIVYNKTEGSRKKEENKQYSITKPFRNIPKEEWRRLYNAHPPLFTHEEFEEIERRFEQSPKSKRTTEKNTTYALTGLCVTPEGDTMSIRKNKRTGLPGTLYPKTINNRPTKYRGCSYDMVFDVVRQVLIQTKDYLDKVLTEEEKTSQINELKKCITEKENELNLVIQSKNKIIDGFLIGLFDENKSIELNKEKDKEIDRIEKEIQAIRNQIDNFKKVNDSIRKTKIERVLEKIDDTSLDREKNEFLKTIIKEIIVDRTEENEMKVKVNFL